MRLLFLFLALTAALGADPSTDRLSAHVANHWKDWTVGTVRVDGPWAVVQLKREGEDGQLLFHLDDGWRHIDVRSRGTLIPSDEMCRVGVPRASIRRFLGEEGRAGGPWWEVLSRLPLTQIDGLARDSWSLMLARNELYARHGRPFQDPFLRAYFGALPWYRVRAGYRDTDLTALERANAKALADLERQVRAQEAAVR